MLKKDGEIVWDEEVVVDGGVSVVELRFHKQGSGEFAGRYHPMFWQLPQVFLSNFIDPDWTHWRAWLGADCIGSNVVYVNGRVASTVEAKAEIEKFANS